MITLFMVVINNFIMSEAIDVYKRTHYNDKQ